MYELNKHYGWSKFIIVVPSIAIRESVYKSFQVTQEHFAEEYGKKIRFFIYNSTQLTEIDRFASDNSINVMIINYQAFNAKGKDGRRIYMKLDEFRSRRPIDIIAKTNPIVIIDEPQSVEGKQTKKNLEEFHPLMTLRYSATHKSDSIYNMVYRLDAMEVYNKKLVKKIAVKGIRESGTTATDSYVYLKGINLSKADPTATIQFHVKGASGIKTVSKKVGIGFNLYPNSGEMEEYKNNFIVKSIDGRDDSVEFINSIKTHAGYFSIDKKGRMINSKVRRSETSSDDVDAYDLIMKNKELLLERNPKKSPVRFIFSHSALREEWDNPNVFQICTLKQSSSDVRKHQEVGRGMRLCVNEDGDRMDENALGADVHNINILTVIASESYDKFATKGLQSEIAEAVSSRPRRVTEILFENARVHDKDGNEEIVDYAMARRLIHYMIKMDYIDENDALTDKFYEDKANGEISFGAEMDHYKSDFIVILDSIYDDTKLKPENARSNNVELKVNPDRLAMPEFQALWSKINARTAYVVDFDTDELVRKAVAALDSKLHVSKIFFKVETGSMKEIKSKDDLLAGSSFEKQKSGTYDQHKVAANTSVKYDLVGKLVEETGITRKAVIQILTGIQLSVFNQFKDNPEEFIIQAAKLINNEKATAIIQHITYDVLDDRYDTDLFTDATIKGKLDVNAMKADKHLFDHIVYDSINERKFAQELDVAEDVAVYVKLPDGFYISTPVGHYNPDWAIAFKMGTVKHIYFVAETKGSMDTLELRGIENAKIHCAREHFKAISGEDVVYDVVDSYQALLEKVMK